MDNANIMMIAGLGVTCNTPEAAVLLRGAIEEQ